MQKYFKPNKTQARDWIRAKMFNELPNNMKYVDDTKTFKRKLRLRYGKEENDLNKKHEVWKSAKLSQTYSIKQTYLDVYLK